ncbi:MAG: hypothetical protein ACE5D8_02850 [Fidelibacterota bacterium]
MTAGQWLNSLTFLDHVVILGLFALACGITWWLVTSAKHIYQRMQKDNPYAQEFRITPLPFMAIAIVITVLLYSLLGAFLTRFLESIIS